MPLESKTIGSGTGVAAGRRPFTTVAIRMR